MKHKRAADRRSSKGLLRTELFSNKNISLIEDTFGTHIGDDGVEQLVKRFTWKNHNNVQVQVISYGARIVSVKIPNKKNVAEDVVLGFDDLAGYIDCDKVKFGATIGRCSDLIEKATFSLNGIQHWLTPNFDPHHRDGGTKGFDKVLWIPHVEGSKLFLSYISKDNEEGYPGDLLVRIGYELSDKNEFSVEMEAMSTKPTIINLSNLVYFNLAGHGASTEGLYKHEITVNANCFTPLQESGLPSGVIQNVARTEFDFQVPTILGKVIGIKPDDGISGNLCVNRAENQEICFVARAFHPPSGRILEVYSNQRGVEVVTANEFDYGVIEPPPEEEESDDLSLLELIEFIDKLRLKILSEIDSGSQLAIEDLVDLIKNLVGEHFVKPGSGTATPPQSSEALENMVVVMYKDITSPGSNMSIKIVMDPEHMEEIRTKSEPDTINGIKIQDIIEEVIKQANKQQEEGEGEEQAVEGEEKTEDNVLVAAVKKAKEEAERKAIDLEMKIGEGRGGEEEEVAVVGPEDEEAERERERKEMERKGMIKTKKKKPINFNDGRIRGKNQAVYRRHGAMAIKTQNYPNAIYYKNFPDPSLKPGQTYKHKIIYKFWVRSGNPNNWIKRNFPPV